MTHMCGICATQWSEDDTGCPLLSLSTLFETRSLTKSGTIYGGGQKTPVILLSLSPAALGFQVCAWQHLAFHFIKFIFIYVCLCWFKLPKELQRSLIRNAREYRYFRFQIIYIHRMRYLEEGTKSNQKLAVAYSLTVCLDSTGKPRALLIVRRGLPMSYNPKLILYSIFSGCTCCLWSVR